MIASSIANSDLNGSDADLFQKILLFKSSKNYAKFCFDNHISRKQIINLIPLNFYFINTWLIFIALLHRIQTQNYFQGAKRGGQVRDASVAEPQPDQHSAGHATGFHLATQVRSRLLKSLLSMERQKCTIYSIKCTSTT